MDDLGVGYVTPEEVPLNLDIKDYVFFVRQAITVDYFDFFKTKLFYAINTCAVCDFIIKLPIVDQVLKAVDLMPNVWRLLIRFRDEYLAVNNNDFETLTKKIGNKTKLQHIDLMNFDLPNNWERVCKKNFQNLSNLSRLCIYRPAPKISINVIDLHDLMTEKNISVSIFDIQDDSFVELPEFKHRFKLQEQSTDGKRLYISKSMKFYHCLPL
uniref:DUF38 domain-containing protein n=1 Tax=Panagrolaimus sp. JU765 TaxID=591449 RepID=A0AC34R8F8_9BILA